MRLGSALHPILPPSTFVFYICWNVLFLLILVMVVIYIVVVVVVILSLSLLCCLLRIPVSSRLFPFLVVNLYIFVYRMCLSLCARVNNIFFVSRLATCNPALASHRLSISLRSLGTEVTLRLFPTPPSSGDLRVFCVGSFEKPINPIASIHLDPRVIEDFDP